MTVASAPKPPSAPLPPAAPVAVTCIDSSLLERLVGYNARRASPAMVEVFTERMAVYELPVIGFSILSLIAHNPGITSCQLSGALKIQTPNMVAKINSFEKRGLIERQPHPQDGRAVGLHLTPEGITLMTQAERTAVELEDAATHRLSSAEKKTLMRLLQKVYL